MTIMDKEDTKKTAKSKKKKVNKEVKKKKNQPIWFYKLLSFLLIVCTVITFGTVIYNQIFGILSTIIMIIIGILVIGIISFILNVNKLRMWVKNLFSIFAILIIIFDLLMIFFGTTTLKFLSNITDTGYRVETYGVYVLKSSKYKNIDDLDNKELFYLDSLGNESILKAIKKIEKEIDVNEEGIDDIDELLSSLTNDNAIVFESSYEDVLDDEHEDTYKNLKKIYSVDIVKNVDTIKSDVDLTKEPFIVYISGIDTTGNISSKARSDVNILLAVNPNTNNILMINTPRDYYVKLHTSGEMDKLTHAGLYGIEESVYTLGDLYNVDIDYYVRANFTSVLKMIDALDGIKVDVPVKFCEQDSNRSFDKNDLICLNKGYQTLNGEQALALARHRKTLATGDRARGNNQMLVLEAMINKALSPKIITNYSSLIAALDGRVTTNMTSDEMFKFAKKQVKDMNSWNFYKLGAKGTDGSGVCYSVGRYKSYVMEQDSEYVNVIQKAIKDLMGGKEKIVIEEKKSKTTSY